MNIIHNHINQKNHSSDKRTSPPTPQRGEQPTLGSGQICNNVKSSQSPPFGGTKGGLNHSSEKINNNIKNTYKFKINKQ